MIFLSLALVAVGITLYPLVSNFLSETNRSLVETKYVKAVELMDDSERISARMDAQAYNATLPTVTAEPYTKEALRQAAESYDDLLNIRGDGIMGYVEIPTLGVELPIYHGTEEETLDRGVGHLLGSSLPVGGTGTHCVITGHSGLAGQRLFSDLNKLKKGDIFFLKTLDETLAYMVLDINTVLPEDTGKLTIDPDRDSCTLITCTPYGVNTHRLLVRGERIQYETAASIVEEKPVEEAPTSTWTEDYLHGIGYGVLGIAGLAVLVGICRMLPKRSKRQAVKAAPARQAPRPSVQAYPPPRAEAPAPARRSPRYAPPKKRRLFPQRRRGKHEAR